MKKFVASVIAPMLAFSIPSAASAATNLITNGDFETGNMSGWTVTGTNYTWATTTANPKSGAYAATMGCVGASCLSLTAPADTLKQTIATTVGEKYTLTFDYSPGSGTVNGLIVLWGGTNVFSSSNLTSTSLTTYTVTNMVATGTNTVLTFLGRQDPAYLVLDNVKLVAQTGVPEPATWMTFMLGFAAIGFGMRNAGTRQKRVRYSKA